MGDYMYNCDKCPRTFKLEEFFEKHKKVHELKKQHKCDVCGFVYGAAKGLEGHLKTHSDEEVAAAALLGAQKKMAAIANKRPASPEPPYMNFQFLNPRGVLAQAPVVAPAPVPTVSIRRSVEERATAPGGSGSYDIYGEFSK